MTPPVRVLHFADSHIGMENYGRTDPATGLNSRLIDYLRRMDDLCAYAREHEADLVIFAGDAFRTRTPSPTHQREFAHRIRELASIAPVVLLEGNHDLPQMEKKASSIEIYDTLGVPNVLLASTFETRVIETRRGPVCLGLAPYPLRQRLMADERTHGHTIEEIDRMLAHQLGVTLEGLADEAEAHDMPRILVGHFTISGAVWGSERSIMLGRDVEAPLSVVADPRWDYVAMGHIHRHQDVAQKLPAPTPPVIYSGSLERIDFGEEGDVKGFVWLEVTRGSADWRFVPLAARPFVTLRFNLREHDAPTEAVLAQIAGRRFDDAVVRMVAELSPEGEARFDEKRLRDALYAAGANLVAGVQRRVEQTQRTRLGEASEDLTDQELLDRYLKSRGISAAQREILLGVAGPFMMPAVDDPSE